MTILAHGDHPITSLWEAIVHQFTHVDHLVTMAAAVGLGVLVWSIRSVRRRRAVRVESVERGDDD